MKQFLIKNFLPLFVLKSQINYFITCQILNFRLKKLKIDQFKSTDSFKKKIFKFLKNQSSDDFLTFYYSKDSSKPTLYAFTYSLITLSIIDFKKFQNNKHKKKWVAYLDSFQNIDDGLFHDKNILNDAYNNQDWWGCRHLALHVINTYECLDAKPKHQFKFLEKYYSQSSLENWLNQYNWNDYDSIMIGDLDNKIMNIGCLLQYQRDHFDNNESKNSLEMLKILLKNKINLKTGVWGEFDPNNKEQISRCIQFAYHLLTIFFYDDEFDFDTEKIINLTLSTQNKLGGFGVKLNSSACEDIDSIYLLVKLYPFGSSYQKFLIDKSLVKALKWISINQEKDGGFVFRVNEPFYFGHPETSSSANQSSTFATWFRTLSLAYIYNHFSNNQLKITKCPGY